MADTKAVAQQIIDNVERVIVGKHDTVQLAIIGLLCQGHLLIEDVPGVGKTMLAKSLARSIGCEFRRIQFTPDMLPSDVTGVRIFNQQTREFVYQPGPIQANIVLADEINRATPKTQAALLEAMEERQVTIDGETHKLDEYLLLSTCWQRRTRSNTKAPFPYPKLSSIDSCCVCGWAIRKLRTRLRYSIHNSASIRSTRLVKSSPPRSCWPRRTTSDRSTSMCWSRVILSKS